eukprot:409744-Rhodomonas_salina.2
MNPVGPLAWGVRQGTCPTRFRGARRCQWRGACVLPGTGGRTVVSARRAGRGRSRPGTGRQSALRAPQGHT